MADTSLRSSTLGRVLVCLDGSPRAEAGLSYALAISRSTGAEIRLLDVLDSTPGSHLRPVDALGVEVARAKAIRYLSSVAARLAAEAKEHQSTSMTVPEIRIETAEGRPAEQILQVADRENVDLIVLTAHGENDTTLFPLGSTAQKVAQNARQSLVLVHSENETMAPLNRRVARVLVLLDGSAAAESALPSALGLARVMGTEVVLAHVVVRAEFPTCEPLARQDRELLAQLSERSTKLAQAYLRKVERSLRDEGIACRCLVAEHPNIVRGALALAQEHDTDLIMMTSHGHTSSSRVVHGGVTHQLLVNAKRPVWVVQNLHVSAKPVDALFRDSTPTTTPINASVSF